MVSKIDSHFAWLQSVGMVVNFNKTEAVIFIRTEQISISALVNGKSFKTSQSIKVLGVIFDSRLKWDFQVDKVIYLAKKTMYGLRIIWQNFGLNNFMNIITSKFFSKIYYGSPVWLGHLTSPPRTLTESIA